MRRSTAWRTKSLSPLDIALDRQNPRINIEETDAESDIIRKLLTYEEVGDLATKIARGGLLPGERVIVTVENNQYIVLEGNRRICACKLLLSPGLIPPDFKKSFPKLANAVEINRLQRVWADVSPDRRTAEPILTLRHTETGIRRWKPVARMRRVKRLLDEQFSVEEIAAEYKSTASNIRKTIREFRLLQLAQNLGGLTPAERTDLDSPDLKTNPFTRFFELQGVKEFLGIKFDENGNASIDPPRRSFDEKLKKVVRAFLHDQEFNTRTDPAEVLGSEFTVVRAGLNKAPRTKSEPQASPGEPTPPQKPSTPHPTQTPPVRPDRFFETLACRIQSNSIAAVVTEIRKCNPDLLPISGTYLLRTLIELCLRRLVDNSGRSAATKGGDPTLTDLVNFALQHRADVFPHKRMADVIDSARSQRSFDYLNIVAHQKWMNADPTQLKSVANQLRNFIQHVVEGAP